MGLKLHSRADRKQPVVSDLKLADIGVILATEHPWFGQPFIVGKNYLINLGTADSRLIDTDKNCVAKPVEPGSCLAVEPLGDSANKTIIDNDKLLNLLNDASLLDWLERQERVVISRNEYNTSCSVEDNGNKKDVYRKTLREALVVGMESKPVRPTTSSMMPREHLSDSELLDWLEENKAKVFLESNGTEWTCRPIAAVAGFNHSPWSKTIRQAIRLGYKENYWKLEAIKAKSERDRIASSNQATEPFVIGKPEPIVATTGPDFVEPKGARLIGQL